MMFAILGFFRFDNTIRHGLFILVIRCLADKNPAPSLLSNDNTAGLNPGEMFRVQYVFDGWSARSGQHDGISGR
jgi:hypothetical protein